MNKKVILILTLVLVLSAILFIFFIKFNRIPSHNNPNYASEMEKYDACISKCKKDNPQGGSFCPCVFPPSNK